MRGWTAPTYTPTAFRDLVYDPAVRAPICFDPEAARTVMPYYELRTRLGMEGKSPDQIADGVEAALATGALPKREAVTFAYMWSADQHLGPGVGHWHPHMMVFSPYYTNAMLGANDFARPLPFVSDDGGTPFAVELVDSTVGGIKAALSRGRSKLSAVPARTVALPRKQPSAETRRVLRLYVERFNRCDWDGLRELIAADARLRVADCFAGRLDDSPYFTNYERWRVTWRLALGEVDGELAIIILRHGDSGESTSISTLLPWAMTHKHGG